MTHKLYAFLMGSMLLMSTGSGPVYAQTPLEQAVKTIPVIQLQALAKEVFKELVQHYQQRNLNGFIDLVSEDFLSTDGKRKADLERSLEIDFEELYNPRINVTSVNQAMVNENAHREVTLVANWNRQTDVEINVRRSRWIFEGRAEFKFTLETDDDLEEIIENTLEGEEPDFSAVQWEMRLSGLRGDGLFGLTTMEGLLQVVPSTGRGRSLLDGKVVTVPVAIGETGALSSVIMNQDAILTTGGPQSIDFSAGRVLGGPGVGDLNFGVVASTFTVVGSARIARITSAASDDFDSYNKDTDPTLPAALAVVGGVYLVKTNEGKFAKFVVTSLAGAPLSVTIKYAFQQDGSGNLSSLG